MMKDFSNVGWSYMMYGLATCLYFSIAAIAGWRGPDFGVGRSSYSGGGSYYGGSSYGRSSGGSWGGGK